jgi:methylated-DNA-[protein]-cysteine S-methyltransferase
MKKQYYFKTIDSPIGELRLVASEKGLAGILWKKERPGRVNLNPQVEDKNNKIILETAKQLKEYFSGKRKVFDLPLDFKGTDFQKSVWEALIQIPYGETRTYGEIAKQLKRPKAMRAVGAANGKNPIAIIAACHRVIGASGALTGFAGGIETKAHLLNIEKE